MLFSPPRLWLLAPFSDLSLVPLSLSSPLTCTRTWVSTGRVPFPPFWRWLAFLSHSSSGNTATRSVLGANMPLKPPPFLREYEPRVLWSPRTRLSQRSRSTSGRGERVWLYRGRPAVLAVPAVLLRTRLTTTKPFHFT